MLNAPESPEEHARQPAQYSFLIRFWRSSPHGLCHATLQRTTHEPALHFSGIDLLFGFLLTQLGEDAPALSGDETQFDSSPGQPH